MANNVKVIATDAEFDPELTNAGTKLVVVDFYATWYCFQIAEYARILALFRTNIFKCVLSVKKVKLCSSTT